MADDMCADLLNPDDGTARLNLFLKIEIASCAFGLCASLVLREWILAVMYLAPVVLFLHR